MYGTLERPRQFFDGHGFASSRAERRAADKVSNKLCLPKSEESRKSRFPATKRSSAVSKLLLKPLINAELGLIDKVIFGGLNKATSTVYVQDLHAAFPFAVMIRSPPTPLLYRCIGTFPAPAKLFPRRRKLSNSFGEFSGPL